MQSFESCRPSHGVWSLRLLNVELEQGRHGRMASAAFDANDPVSLSLPYELGGSHGPGSISSVLLRKHSGSMRIIRNAKFRIPAPQPASPVSTGQHVKAPQNDAVPRHFAMVPPARLRSGRVNVGEGKRFSGSEDKVLRVVEKSHVGPRTR
jgi:hypothetical protein